MTMKTFTIIIVWFSFGIFEVTSLPGKPAAKMKLNDLTLCDTTSSNPAKGDFYLKNLDSDGYKAITGTLQPGRVLNNDIYLTFVADKYNDGDWNEGIVTKEGQFCDIMLEYVSGGWKTVRNHLSPKIESECEVPDTSYKFDNFQLFKEDLDQTPSIFGRFQVKAQLYDGDEIIMCLAGEVTVSEM